MFARDSGDPVAGLHLDVADRVGRAVVGAELGERRAELRVDVAVARGEAPPVDRTGEAELDAAAARRADVLEETGVRRARRRADEEDVVVERRLIRGRMPSHGRGDRSAHARLHGLRDDRIERRVGEERVRQRARRGRIGAGELDRRGNAHALVVVDVRRQRGHRLECRADRRVEPAEPVVSVERRIGPRQIPDVHLGPVVASAQRNVEPRGGRQRVGEIESPVLIRGACLRLGRERTDRDVRAIGSEVRLLLALGEIGAARVEAHAQRELVRQGRRDCRDSCTGARNPSRGCPRRSRRSVPACCRARRVASGRSRR